MILLKFSGIKIQFESKSNMTPYRNYRTVQESFSNNKLFYCIVFFRLLLKIASIPPISAIMYLNIVWIRFLSFPSVNPLDHFLTSSILWHPLTECNPARQYAGVQKGSFYTDPRVFIPKAGGNCELNPGSAAAGPLRPAEDMMTAPFNPVDFGWSCLLIRLSGRCRPLTPFP